MKYQNVIHPRRSKSPMVGSTMGAGLLAAVGAGVGLIYAARAGLRRARWFDLRGKVAVVTGGTRGLGFQIAKELARRGARVAICSRNEAELRQALDELTEAGAEAAAITCDVTKPEEVARLFEVVRERFGAVDVLVNNAGTIVVAPVSHMQLNDYRETMDVNFYGALHATLNVMPEMRERGAGRIVNIASFGGKVPTPHMATYAASKFALVGFSETLRAELMDDGVYVTTVCPGLIRTGSMKNALFKGQHEKEKATFLTSDNLPVVTISPPRIARQIVDALQAGDAELITPFVAGIQSRIHGLLPGLTTDVTALVNLLLPSRSTNRSGDRKRRGAEIDEKPLIDRFTQSRQAAAEAKYQR